jgi:hypothetical protein
MGFLERTPVWVKVLLIGGGALLTYFSSHLPDWLQTAGAYAGLVLVLAGFVGIALHWLKERRGAQQVGPTELIIIGAGGTTIFVVLLAIGLIWQALSVSALHTTEVLSPVAAASPAKQSANDLRDRLIAINRNLSPSDRDRFSNLLDRTFKALGHAASFGGAVSNEVNLMQVINSGRPIDDIPGIIVRLEDAHTNATDLMSEIDSIKNDGGRYSEQINYIYSNDVRGEVGRTRYWVDRSVAILKEWEKIQQKPEYKSPKTVYILTPMVDAFNQQCMLYRAWRDQAVIRFNEMNKSIQ